MSNGRFSAAIRDSVAARAHGLCEYCGSPSDCSPSPFSVEHILPRVRGGSDNAENLAWSCMGCNDHKYTAIQAVDPVSGEVARLFHPRLQRWNEHFIWAAEFTQIAGVSAVGRATVNKLNLNRPAVVKLRRILRASGELPL